MSTKLEQAARQALEALWVCREHNKCYHGETHNTVIQSDEAITALREALAEQAEQKPVAWVDLEQWQSGEYDCFTREKVADYMTPLYTAPVRTKDLTDDELADIVYEMNGNEPTAPFWRDLARAVIAADREKNRG